MAFYRLDLTEMTGPVPSLASCPQPATRRPLDEHDTILERLADMALPTLPSRQAREQMAADQSDGVVPSEATDQSGARRRGFRGLRRTA